MNSTKFASLSRWVAGVALLGFTLTSAWAASPKNVLVVTVTKGFRHSSIPTAEKVLGELATNSGSFSVDYARNDEELKAKMSPDALKDYDGVIFANTTGNLPIPDKQAFIDWIRAGHAFMGMHSASDTFHGYEDFIQMIGGEFRTHHQQVGIECTNEDPAHPATRDMGATYSVFDEIYLFKNHDIDQVHRLLTLDTHPNTKVPGYNPISWCRTYGDGRSFYTALGHREDVWESDSYKKHILGGIQWALGLEYGASLPQCTQLHLSQEELAAGFIPLFNGVNLDGWKLRHADGKKSWSAQNGMLVNEIAEGEHGTDLVTEAKFDDFVLRYEYLVPKGSNSGLYLRGRYEIQILEDSGSNELRTGGNGGIYSVKAPSKFVSRPVGEWQEAEAVIRGNKISVTLNGVKIHDQVEVTKATGGELDSNLGSPGPIMVQGDHGAVAFRNMRIKPLN